MHHQHPTTAHHLPFAILLSRDSSTPPAIWSNKKAGYQGVGGFILNMMQCGNLTIENLEQLATEQDRTEWDYRKVALSFDLHPTTININSNHSPFVMPTFHRHSTSGWWRTHFSGLTSTTLSWRWNSKQRGCHFTSHGWGMFAKYQLLFSAGWLFFQWHVPVCTLFKGRVVYAKPENTIPETSETSGIEVEHEVYMLQGIIL